jgi:hypothetical protein
MFLAVTAPWGGDLETNATGDICVQTVDIELQQRLVRRLLTNPGAYIWHTKYGAGLGQFVGQPYSSGVVRETISDQIRLEPLIATNPAPDVIVTQSLDSTFDASSVSVRYQQVSSPTPTLLVLNGGG